MILTNLKTGIAGAKTGIGDVAVYAFRFEMFLNLAAVKTANGQDLGLAKNLVITVMIVTVEGLADDLKHRFEHPVLLSRTEGFGMYHNLMLGIDRSDAGVA